MNSRRTIQPFAIRARGRLALAVLTGLVVCATLSAPATSLRLCWLRASQGESSESRTEVEDANPVFASLHNQRRGFKHAGISPGDVRHSRTRSELHAAQLRAAAQLHRPCMPFGDCWTTPLRC